MRAGQDGVQGGTQPLLTQPSVLIVDQSEDSREVLRTALRRRGLQTFEASLPQHGLELARQHHPRVIVLDLEVETGDGDDLCGQFARQLGPDHLVVLGSARLRRRADIDATTAGRQFVSKPYHYGALIRKIEELVG
jgi:DNA-binding response OmpR family regulator